MRDDNDTEREGKMKGMNMEYEVQQGRKKGPGPSCSPANRPTEVTTPRSSGGLG